MDLNPADAAAVRDVLAADDRRRAATQAYDADALEALMTEAFTYTHFNGFREGRDGYLGRIRGGGVEYVSLDRRDAQVRIFGDVAVIDGKASMTYRLPSETKPNTVHNLYLAVWRRIGGAWRIEAYASTLEVDGAK
jgi:ketosteroid isomerase-like protein